MLDVAILDSSFSSRLKDRLSWNDPVAELLEGILRDTGKVRQCQAFLEILQVHLGDTPFKLFNESARILSTYLDPESVNLKLHVR